MSFERILAVLVSLCALFLLMPVLALSIRAVDAEIAVGAEIDPEAGLPEEVRDSIGAYDGSVEGFGARFLDLLSQTLGRVKELGLSEGLRTLGSILAAALLCAILEEGPRTKAAVPLVGALTIVAACARPLDSMIALGTETIRELHAYTELLLPAMGTLMTLSGNAASAAVSGLGIVLFDFLQGLISTLLVPTLYLLVTLTAAEAALGLEQLGALRGFVRWLLISAVKLLMWGYSAILTLTGLVSGAVDAQKIRTLRAAIAGMVPVVGNLVSEASTSLISAASLLRTASGLYGMLAVMGICLGPFFRIALQFMILKLAVALCGLFGKGSQAPLLEKLTEAMALVLALTGVACLISLMILVLCIRMVNP